MTSKITVGVVVAIAIAACTAAYTYFGSNAVSKLPATQALQTVEDPFVLPNTQTMSEAELREVVARGPQPGTVKVPTAPPPSAPAISSTPKLSEKTSSAPTSAGSNTEQKTNPELTTEPTAPSTPSGITRTALASHNTAADCWVGFEGNVYNVTVFIPKHPGGDQAISRLCGKAEEFETAFLAKHGREKVGAMMQVAPKMGVLQ